METAAKTATNGDEKSKPASTARLKAGKKRQGASAKTGKAQVPARAVLERLVGKRVRYVGRNAKHRGKLVVLRAVRTTKDAPCGYDVRLALGDGSQYCSVTSVKLA